MLKKKWDKNDNRTVEQKQEAKESIIHNLLSRGKGIRTQIINIDHSIEYY